MGDIAVLHRQNDQGIRSRFIGEYTVRLIEWTIVHQFERWAKRNLSISEAS